MFGTVGGYKIKMTISYYNYYKRSDKNEFSN
jgi:hypothetical protein